MNAESAGVAALPRTTTRVYDETTLFLSQVIREPSGNNDERLVKTFTPSPTGTGLVVGMSQSDATGVTRGSSNVLRSGRTALSPDRDQ